MLWVTEGFVLDDSGHLIVTTFIDLRDDSERTRIPSLVKGCEQRFALEDGETILLSKPARFRHFGEEMIQDTQEGLANEETVFVTDETPAEAARQRAISDLNEARELSQSRLRMVHRQSHSTSNKDTKNLAFAKEWWIFSTSIKPSNDEREAWSATLPKEYDHVSEIGQPAKFAQALAHMVAEQIGPQGKGAVLTDSSEGSKGHRTKHKAQWVMHGPVVYTDNVYAALTRDLNDNERLASFIFTKSIEYAPQREYRFAVLNDGADEETLLLRISGMMRDALRVTGGRLERPSPWQSENDQDDQLESSSSCEHHITPTYGRRTTKKRVVEREESRWEIRAEDGKLRSSEDEIRENVKERIVTESIQPDDGSLQSTFRLGKDDRLPNQEIKAANPTLELDNTKPESREEEAVEDLALEERDWKHNHPAGSFTIPVIHRGSGRAYKSFEDALGDPSFPMNPIRGAWQEKACSPEEIIKTYAAIETLDWKIPHIKEEFRQDAASAAWYALHCVRNIYAQLGDVVESMWIERERFVVIRLEDSKELSATGRIVIGPSGAYAYCLQLPDRESSGHGGENVGMILFPAGDQVKSFESFGWPNKRK